MSSLARGLSTARRSTWALALCLTAGAFASGAEPEPQTGPQDPVGEILRRATESVQRITTPVEQADAWLRIGQARARRREKQAASEAFAAAADAAAQVKVRDIVLSRKPHPIIQVAEAQAAAGEREAAHKTFLRGVDLLAAPDFGQRPWDWGKIVLAQIRTQGLDASASTIWRYRKYAEEGRAKDREILRSQVLQARGDFFQITYLMAWCGDYKGAVHDVLTSEDFQGPLTDPEAVRRGFLVELLKTVPRKDGEAARPLFDAARKAVDDAGLPGRPVTGETYWSRADDYGTIAEALARMGRFKEALETISQAPKIKDPPHPLGTRRATIALAYIHIADLQREAGDLAGAIASVDMAVPFCSERGGRVQPWPAHLGVDVLVRAKALDKARDLTEVIFPADKSPEVADVMKADLLEEMAIAEAVPHGPQASRVTFDAAFREANACLAAALRIPEERRRYWTKPEPATHSATTAARIRTRLGDKDGALRVIESLPNAEMRDEVRRGLAIARAEAGQWNEAFAIIGSIEADAIRDRAWIDVGAEVPVRGPDGGSR
ncbi:hypothetical protein [Singulisphaera sp. PoT]|uniref:hypothetical protein n=1 Tax=Singulisphaera sp. PoT TaxID=3411797 RepID=UPI003BF5D576